MTEDMAWGPYVTTDIIIEVEGGVVVGHGDGAALSMGSSNQAVASTGFYFSINGGVLTLKTANKMQP